MDPSTHHVCLLHFSRGLEKFEELRIYFLGVLGLKAFYCFPIDIFVVQLEKGVFLFRYLICRKICYVIFLISQEKMDQLIRAIHPGRSTWNLQITHLERKMIFQTSMIMFHVNLQGCIDSIFFSNDPGCPGFWNPTDAMLESPRFQESRSWISPLTPNSESRWLAQLPILVAI